ncbi:MAG: tRNA 5-methoxyuridine(34)/uridine 5-oxyacetic acid(34) synthase CmoB [Gammaproteobacteria bacterium]|nr:tRNA 5-methoxyuridine(34)/uridine 5-oxyacetic acid(34) synthase CmoB [Gammaproteobacteria bacterium]
MIDYQPLIQRWQHGELECWAQQLQAQIAQDFHERRYGNLPKWMQALAQLPEIKASSIDLQQDTIRVGSRSDLGPGQAQQLQTALRSMHPWRKGPFDLFGVHIDTEWRSDWKWNRLAPAVAPLPGRRVLDVGCGSGYHCWRMLGAGAAEVIGIDPSPLFVIQFWALQHYIQRPDIWVLPLGIEHLPGKLEAFDTVFSMGVLYHRRSPIDHLMELRDSLRAGGELVLETLVIEGNSNACLVPSGRYARMSNVWFIPSCDQLANWLGKIGLKNIELVDVTVTRCEEQRSTEWMKFQSLSDFLDPADSSKSIEGYPAPRRAIFTATK